MAQFKAPPKWNELANSLNSRDWHKCLWSMECIHNTMFGLQKPMYVQSLGVRAGWEPILVMIVASTSSEDDNREKRIRMGIEVLENLAIADDKYRDGIVCFFMRYHLTDTVREGVVRYFMKYGGTDGVVARAIRKHIKTKPNPNHRRHHGRAPRAKVHEEEDRYQSEIKDAQDDGSDDDNAANVHVDSYGREKSPAAQTDIEPELSVEPSVEPREQKAQSRSGRPASRKRAVGQGDIQKNAYLEYKNKRSLKIFIGTWNVAEQQPTDKIDIALWLNPHDGVAVDADIFVLGLQEIVPLNNTNVSGAKRLVRMKSNPTTAREAWEEKIKNTLAEQFRDLYCLVATHHYVGVMLCVFAKEPVHGEISNVMMGKKGVGIGDFAGNKNGVGISMKIYDSEVCFVCSHLEAHKNDVAERNKDYRAIIEELRFDQQPQKQQCDDQKQQSAPPKKVKEHDMIFWLGDLNYRLNHKCLETVKKCSIRASSRQIFGAAQTIGKSCLLLTSSMQSESTAAHSTASKRSRSTSAQRTSSIPNLLSTASKKRKKCLA